jgi:signal transduction histidine kinase/CheY-like chemotaxis protein/nitrogen-specific signal transduction histidine kinase
MRSKNSLRFTLLLSLLCLTLFTVGTVGSIWIQQEYAKFETESQALRASFLVEQKKRIKQEVDRVTAYIDYQRSTTETALKLQIKKRVDQAWSLANALYQRYHTQKSAAEIQGMIREALRELRFSQGRGYYFIYELGGTNVLLPFSPQLEGTNLWDLKDSKGLYTIRRFNDIIVDQGAGYLRWHWYKPGETKRMSEKIGYSRRFAPYNWFIGTGEYIEDMEQEIQAQTLAWINSIRFGQDGYIFVYDYQANTLAHYKAENIGVNQWSFRDVNGIAVLQQLIEECQKNGSTYLNYQSTIRPTTGKAGRKMAYARSVDAWQWIVGSGVYLDKLDSLLAEKRDALNQKIRHNLFVITALLVTLFSALLIISRMIVGRIGANLQKFTLFFEQAATGNAPIDERKVHFSEFRKLAHTANCMVNQRQKAEAEVSELQEQLVRSRKMEALGVLAGGVAHDLNNVLSAVVGYPDMLLASMGKDNPQRRAIEAIRDSGIKASEIVQDLLTLARRGILQPVVLDLNRLIRSFLTAPEWARIQEKNPNQTIETNLAPDLLRIKGSRVHLQKTVMNLIANAAEAQPTGGQITISTTNCYLDAPPSGYTQVNEGDYVVLTVRDQGSGIAPGDQDRIFEPFFSKKNIGQSGTGLGMTVVWGTVEDHAGYITLHSEVGKGTEFCLYFPATREEEPGQVKDKLEGYCGRGERLLVVDDLEEQRVLASIMLEGLGYSVTTATSGEEAIERLQDEDFELVLLDMIMRPGIDGLETYQRILLQKPQQRAIIVSGFAQTEQVREAMRLGVQGYLKKPFTLAGMARVVAEALTPPESKPEP